MNIILAGDFNCKNIKWEEFEVEVEENTWGVKVSKLATENFMIKWIKKGTRFKDEPVRQDLISAKGTDLLNEVQNKCPLRKSDHEVLQIEINEVCDDTGSENYKEKIQNQTKAKHDD